MMHQNTFYRYTILGAVIMALLFMGNRLSGQALQIDIVDPTVETTAATEETAPPSETEALQTPQTQSTLPDSPVWQACQDADLASQAEHIFVYDLDAGQMLYCSTDVHDSMYPASITKLFSAYVALQYLPCDTVVTAGWELGLLQPGSSSAGIGLDNRLTVQMLVEGMLLPSGNDAAYVLAAAAGRVIAGDDSLSAKEAVAAFMEQVNKTAADVGLSGSNFVSPDGYHDREHFSCPEDIAKIASLALSNPVIAQYVGMQQDTVCFASGQRCTWSNTNRLLNPNSSYYCPDAIGLKTGYTLQAGYCLLSAFRRDERTILVGIFGGADKLTRYSDAVLLWELAAGADSSE